MIANEGEDALLAPPLADDRGAGRRTRASAFVLSAMVGPPVRLRGRARHRRARPVRCARRGPRSRRPSSRRRPLRPADGDEPARRLAADARAAGRRSSTACAPATTTATSRPAPRCGSRRCCATRSASCRSTRTRSSTARSARRASWSRTSPPRSRRRSRSSPARSTRSSTRPRPSPSASRARDETLLQVPLVRRCSPRARRATASPTRPAHARRARPAVDEVAGLHPLPHRGRRLDGGATDRGRRPRRHARRPPVADRPTTRDCGAPSTVAREQEVMVARGRSDGRSS